MHRRWTGREAQLCGLRGHFQLEGDFGDRVTQAANGTCGSRGWHGTARTWGTVLPGPSSGEEAGTAGQADGEGFAFQAQGH